MTSVKKASALIVCVFAFFGSVAQAAITTETLDRDPRECVDYARSKVSTLPRGLYTFNEKLRIINSHSCREKSAAITECVNDFETPS